MSKLIRRSPFGRFFFVTITLFESWIRSWFDDTSHLIPHAPLALLYIKIEMVTIYLQWIDGGWPMLIGVDRWAVSIVGLFLLISLTVMVSIDPTLILSTQIISHHFTLITHRVSDDSLSHALFRFFFCFFFKLLTSYKYWLLLPFSSEEILGRWN